MSHLTKVELMRLVVYMVPFGSFLMAWHCYYGTPEYYPRTKNEIYVYQGQVSRLVHGHGKSASESIVFNNAKYKLVAEPCSQILLAKVCMFLRREEKRGNISPEIDLGYVRSIGGGMYPIYLKAKGYDLTVLESKHYFERSRGFFWGYKLYLVMGIIFTVVASADMFLRIKNAWFNYGPKIRIDEKSN